MTDARALHADAVVVDTHDDLLMLVARRPRREQGSYFRDSWLPQLRDGGVDVQVLPVFIDDEYRPEGALRQTLKMLEAGWTVAEQCADEVALCLTGSDVDAAVAAGKVALVLALEGCEAVGRDVELLSVLYRVGVRIASLTHFGRTLLADGSGEDAAGSRLTRAGVEAVAVMEELGMLLDVSHLGAVGVDHVLEVARRPVIATHSSAYELRSHHRNLTDERLEGIAAGGGVVNVNLFAGFLDDDPDRATVARAVDHLEHVAALAGIRAVGLGPDFLDQVFAELYPGVGSLVVEGVDAKRYVPGLEGPRGLPLLTEEMVRRGWPEDDIRAALGGNDLRLFRSERCGRNEGSGGSRDGTEPVQRADRRLLRLVLPGDPRQEHARTDDASGTRGCLVVKQRQRSLHPRPAGVRRRLAPPVYEDERQWCPGTVVR